MQPDALAHQIKLQAASLGFKACGITRPVFQDDIGQPRFTQWLGKGYQGDMDYLARNPDSRFDARSLMPDCRSVIVLAMPYAHPSQEARLAHPPKVARYAQGLDYHEVVRSKLSLLANWLSKQAPGVKCRITVDTSPISEKSAAIAAGIGWRGKHSLVLNDQLGSWFVLGLLLVTIELPFNAPVAEKCHTCRRCLDACPVNALVQPYLLDARRCISYLTTVRKTAPDTASLHGWLYGCDECQLVCPFNQNLSASSTAEFAARPAVSTLTYQQLAEIDETNWKTQHAGTELGRRPLAWIRGAVPPGEEL